MPQRLLRLVLLSAGLSAAGAMSGCGSDGLATGKEIAESELYWALELNHHAVTLAPPEKAPYDTLTLTATPRTIKGVPLDELPAPTYVSGNPEKVTVTSDGVLRAIAPTDPGEIVPVVATLTSGNLKHADTASVVVLTADPLPVLTSFSIHPTPNNEGYADSAKVGEFGSSTSGTSETTTCFALPTWTHTPLRCQILLPVRVLDATGAPIPGVPVAFRSSDKEAALVLSAMDRDFSGKIFIGPHQPLGQVTFYASTTVFGVTKADTLPFEIGWRVLATIQATRTGFEFPVLRVGVGAVVVWVSYEPFGIDVNFADPANVAKVGQPPPSFFAQSQVLKCQFLFPMCEEAGNIVLTPNPMLNGLSQAYRRFPVPGTYDYSSTALGGASGRIVVIGD